MWEKYLNPSNPRMVIYNGVDTEIFYPRNTVIDDEYLLFVGDSERKGLSQIQSFSPRSSLPIYIAGPSSSSISNTKALGRLSQDKLAQYYSGALATIHPAKFEAFGNVILESLACGTPVVASKNCGGSELIDSSCGIVTNDISEGVSQVDQLEKGDCKKKAKNHTWVDVASQTEEAIGVVL
ncbi:MAG: glycosyltransferase [Natrialbaceae archaeon]|nr:glycosyltransferase [Natrialbaceae archaeon]